MNICVYAASSDALDAVYFDAAYELGKLLAAGGHRLVFGGGATSTSGGSTQAEMMRLAAQKGIADLVEFAGEIPSAGPYMTCGRTLIAPSRWEGMPYLLLEAVARGRRVIASDCPGNRDVLAGYARAQLFPVEDAARLASLLEAAE